MNEDQILDDASLGGTTQNNEDNKERESNTTPTKNKVDAAAIIDASAGGLQGLAALAGAFTGNTPQTTVINQAPQQPTNTNNQRMWAAVGIGGGLVLLILIIALSQNKTNVKK